MLGLKDIQNLMANAQKVQEDLRQQMSTIRVEGSSGGGMVRVTIDGHRHVLAVEIEPQVIKPEDREMLQDLIQAALNDAINKVEETVRSQVMNLAGGLKIPGL